ncbi:methylmalonyl Co-A mutase-associated GTPase MeaB [bacterium]|nr:methylmalonyl Co-A mutase-associated GTPase MeaB [bacterium]
MENLDQTLLERFREGDRRSLSRLLTRIENRDPSVPEILDTLYPRTGDAWRLGVTGPPGAGKSTLVNRLVGSYRKKELPVGVIAFDPTSPFTGGALLGDRVRMETVSQDPGVFIRSMATRGHLGGLSVGVDEACDLMDAFGKERIIIETVGVGQSELEVANSADTTIVVLVPQSGDAIQAMKAGLMEIADLYILNKCDRDGADHAFRELVSTVSLKAPEDGWRPPVLRTVAEKGEGLDEVLKAIQEHRQHIIDSGSLEERRHARIAAKTKRFVEDGIRKKLWNEDRNTRRVKGLASASSPYELGEQLIDDFYEEIRHERR